MAISLNELLKRRNPLSPAYTPNLMPLPLTLQQQQPTTPYTSPLPPQDQQAEISPISPELITEYEQGLKPPEAQGVLEKYGFTPGVLTNIAAGITALTGGDPYVATGLAKSGGQMQAQEFQAEQARQAQLGQYVREFRRREAAQRKSEQKALAKQQQRLPLELKTIKGRNVWVNPYGDIVKSEGVAVSPKDVVLAAQGMQSVNELKDIMFGRKMSEGEFQNLFIGTKLGVVASQPARLARGAMLNSIDVILRQRTGAVIHPSERDQAMKSWGYNIGDTKSTVAKKLDNLEKMYKLMGGDIDPATKEGQEALRLTNKMVADSGVLDRIEKEKVAAGPVSENLKNLRLKYKYYYD